MRILYPYNEILPKRTAHDVYLFNECSALASKGLDVFLLCGRGSVPDASLFSHYKTEPVDSLHTLRLPILRKNNPFGLSWNLPFFFFSQRQIEKIQPDFVLLSVLKQARYHLARKRPGTRYIYEVHQLRHYPGISCSTASVKEEKSILEKADLITVTTHALKNILRAPPYTLTRPIEVIPLGVKASPLPLPVPAPLTIAYVGQLYPEQGVSFLLRSLTKVPHIRLKIIGGTAEEIVQLEKEIQHLHLENRVKCLGFHSPSSLPSLLHDVHAFIAPFESLGRMPYVAHTKVFEYAEWGRPLIAPDLPVVKEHFSSGQGVLFFEPCNTTSLAQALASLMDETLLSRLQKEVRLLSGSFTWEKRANIYLDVFSSFTCFNTC